MSDPMVTVIGPHGRHIEVLQSTQQAIPDAFPLADTTPKKPARKQAPKAPKTKRTPEPPTEQVEEPAAPDSPATADENDTVETTKEAR